MDFIFSFLSSPRWIKCRRARTPGLPTACNVQGCRGMALAGLACAALTRTAAQTLPSSSDIAPAPRVRSSIGSCVACHNSSGEDRCHAVRRRARRRSTFVGSANSGALGESAAAVCTRARCRRQARRRPDEASTCTR